MRNGHDRHLTSIAPFAKPHASRIPIATIPRNLAADWREGVRNIMVVETDSKKFAAALCIFAALALPLLTSIQVYAQVSGATMTGTVSDASGAVIPNAQISIKNVATGQERAVTTDAAGFYSAPNLLPGKYEVTVTAAGFSSEVRSGITLTVGAQQLLNITMKVGQVSEKVQVTGEAPAVQLATSVIGGVVNQAAVVDLPLNGRDWTQLATLQPGVTSVASIQANTGTIDRAHRGYGVELAISGSRPQQNNYRIDGISINDYANGGPGSVEGSTLGVDAIQEFSVLTSNYSAEYGRTSGGVVNAITKSGTNEFHGDAYEFLRNSALDARNYFDGATIPAFRRNQFGGSMGGPIWTDHTFFFGDYEGLRESRGISTPIFVPSPAVRHGILCSIPQPGVCSTQKVTGASNPDPATGIDKAVLPYLGLWALPNEGLVGNGDTGIYSFTTAHITSENFGTGRLDHRFSDKDSVFGSYQYDLATATQPDPANEVLVGNTTGRAFVAIEETHIFNPHLVNSARFGLNRSFHTSEGVRAINPLSANPALGESPGADNPQIDVPGLVSVQDGLNQAEHLNFYENSFQGYDDVFLTKGIHSLKFGFATERIQFNAYDPAPAGDFPFGTLLNFLINHPDTLSAPLPSAPFVHFGFRASIFGGYAQDDVRLRPNLTLNLGLRYEMSTVPAEIRGRLSALRSPADSTPHMGNGLFQNPTLRNFAPRIGFAWDPFGNGKTSVRGGFGMFDVLPLPFLLGQFAINAAPFTENGAVNHLPAGSFPTEAYNILAAQGNSGMGLRIPYVQPNPNRNYVMQWNLNVQREVIPDLTAMVAYVGSRGVHQPFRADDINIAQPTQSSAPPYLWPLPIGSGKPLNAIFGQMDAVSWSTNDTFFDGLEAQIVKRMSHGFQIQGSYTWSRAIDEGGGSVASDAFLNAIPSLLYFFPKYRRAVADFNVAQNLTINYIWNIPTPNSLHGPAAWTARGWQLGGIFEIRSGLPFTPLIGGDPLGLNIHSAPFAYPDRLRGAACQSLVNPGNVNNYIKLQCFALPAATPAIAAQCTPFQPGGPGNPPLTGTCSNLLGNAGRNEVYGPGLVNFDFSVFKDTKIRESLHLEFRAEFFNVFNHSNFNSPIANSTLFNQDGSAVGGAGSFDSTSTSNREIQFALKLIF
jgi:hypothetical protein